MKTRIFTWVLAPLFVLACAGEALEPEGSGGPEAPAAEVEQPIAGSPAALFSGLERLGSELDARAADGSLPEEARSAWARALEARQDERVAAFIAEVQRGATSEELLAFDAAVMERYIEAFGPVLDVLERQQAEGELDEALSALVSAVRGTLDEVAGADQAAESQRAQTFCCAVKNDERTCHQWHTSGLWAGSKCVAAGVGLNRSGSTLTKGACSYGWPTYCGVIK